MFGENFDINTRWKKNKTKAGNKKLYRLYKGHWITISFFSSGHPFVFYNDKPMNADLKYDKNLKEDEADIKICSDLDKQLPLILK